MVSQIKDRIKEQADKVEIKIIKREIIITFQLDYDRYCDNVSDSTILEPISARKQC